MSSARPVTTTARGPVARSSRDFYSDLIRDSQNGRAGFLHERERWLRSVQVDGREELLSVALCTELCDTLIGEGVEDLHFYTLNRPNLTRDVCHALGVTPKAVALEKVA